MDMEVVGETSSDQLLIVKGRRTKRQRPCSPFSVTTTTSSGDRSSSSPMNSVDESFSTTTDEEEDMANCLILLAQGNKIQRKQQQKNQESNGLYVYQCKTCERCFSSFQALGGHRASHKKPKTEHEDKKAASLVLFHQEDEQGGDHHVHIQQQSIKAHNNKANKVHECSICGSEFSSGQALGGHMRRHRTTPPPSTAIAMVNMNHHHQRFTSSESPQEQVMKKSTTNFLALDLNLPAPEEEGPITTATNKYTFSSSLVFSASPMVDCHY